LFSRRYAGGLVGPTVGRLASAAVTVAMAATSLAVISPSTASAATPTKASLGPAQAADEASALLMARLQKRQIEVLGDRTDAAQTFANPNGSLSYTTSADPRWVEKDGSWASLDPTLQVSASGAVQPVLTESPLVLSGGGDTTLATMTVNGKATSLSWPTKLPKPTLSGTTATYADVLPSGVDLQVTATAAGGIETTLVIKNATAAADPGLASLEMAIGASSGSSVSVDAGGNLAIKDAKGNLLINSPAAVMWDSSTTANDAASSVPSPTSSVAGGANAAGPLTVSAASMGAAKGTRSTAKVPGSRARTARVKVSYDKKTRTLRLAADQSMLTSTSTVFPVYVDPAFTPHPASGSTLHWDQVQQAYPTTSNYDAAPGTGLAVGYQGFSSPTGIERTFYNLSVPTAVYGTTILSAKLNTTVSYAATSASNSTTVQAFSTGTINSSTDWNNQPSKDTGSNNPNYPSPNASATFTTTSASPNQAVSFDVTSGMQNIATNKANNWTLGLYNATETNDVDFVRFADNPTFTITYDNPPTTPTGFSASPTATAGYTSSATPTLSAKATDADSDTVRLDYQILSGTTVKASGSSAFVNSGSAGTWADTTSLPDGSYTWKVRAYDGSQYSAWSAAQPLTVDTTAPANTTVASTDFPGNTWSGTPDADGNFTGTFTFTPPTSDTGEVAWQLDTGAWNYTSTTGSTFTQTLTFGAGKHTLIAKTHDAAGNLATGTYYVFYAGSGVALTSPSNGDRTARRVSLTSSGLTTYTGVTYQYRYGETDTWHNVPTGDVTVTSTGAAVSAWPVAVTSGAPAPLTWNITNSLPQDGPVDVRAYFTDGTNSSGSAVATVTVDRNAGTAPTLSVGPASVNALTGDASLAATDASAFGMTATRTSSSRRPTLGSSQSGQAAIFGPQWSSGAVAEASESEWSYLTQTSATSVSLVDADGDPIGFTATSSGGWKPEPGMEALTLTGSLTGSFTLKDTDGTTTTFVRPSGATNWQVSTTSLSTSDSTTTVVPQTVTVGSSTLVRPHYVIAPTSAVSASTCQTTPSTAGCRMLEYVYASTTTATSTAIGDYAGQVQEIKLWATSPGATSATATVIAQYDYDNNGQLRDEWDPRISPVLKTSYTYDGSGRVLTETDPGELPYTFNYGTVGSTPLSGPGMLESVTRPTLQPGSNTVTNGTATTSVVYNVPLSGSAAPNTMDAATVGTWDETNVPADATAVFPADQVPASNDGTTLGSGDYNRATITYTDASGREVNTASPGGHITTTQYDQYGNTVSTLSAVNRELALGTADWQQAQQASLGLANETTSQRAAELSTVSVFNTTSVAADSGTDKNTDPANVGQREVQEYGPIHLVTLTHATTTANGTLPAGTVVPSRQHTLNTFDEGRPTDGTASVSNAITTSQVGAVVNGAPDGDARATKTAYDWVKGEVTSTTDGSGNVTRTGFDSQGRVVSTTQPKSNGSDAGTTVTTYWSATGTGACNGRPEWADLVCSTGPAAAVTGAGSNPTQMPTTTTTYDRWGSPATVAVTANGVTRTTTNTYDAAGRLTLVQVTGGTGTAVPDRTTTYDPVTGQRATASANGQTISYTYDALGRQTQYTDGAGGTTTTSYDALDRPVTVSNSVPSTITYTYDTTKNRSGLVTSMTDSVAGTFTAEYDSDGNLYDEDMPGGVTLSVARDQTGTVTGRTYTRDSDGSLITSDSGDFDIQGEEVDHTSNAGIAASQDYTYDADGRLTAAMDAEGDTTTGRAYTYDADTNRTGLTTTLYNTDGTTASTSTTSYAYDTADRLESVNGIAAAYDALGNTTNQADGSRLTYYANNLAYQDTDGNNSQTYVLDAAERVGTTQTVNDINGTWTLTDTATNHFDDDADSPAWTTDVNSGAVSRYVQGIDGDLAAVTDATGNVVLQLTDMHGDVTVQYPLSTGALTVQAYDEFGNLINSTAPTSYGWLGGKQRASGTPDGLTLMGARLYNPATGRFLQTDPVMGGSANSYDYVDQNPVDNYDLHGTWLFRLHNLGGGYHGLELSRVAERAILQGDIWGIAGGVTALCSLVGPEGSVGCAVIVGIIAGFLAGAIGSIVGDEFNPPPVYLVFYIKFYWKWGFIPALHFKYLGGWKE
jgi:RHS repeat-associated protein